MFFLTFQFCMTTIGLWLLSQILYNYFQCVFTDPGYIEKNSGTDPNRTIDKKERQCTSDLEAKIVVEEEESHDKARLSKLAQLDLDRREKARLSKFAQLECNVYKTKHCRTCCADKPFRAHHCSVCNRWYATMFAVCCIMLC